MPTNDCFSEDYVANLLKREAQERVEKYPILGVSALLPKRATSGAPKPNTRFLKNVIRETTSHNAALKAKELDEAGQKLWSVRASHKDDRGRRLGDEGRHLRAEYRQKQRRHEGDGRERDREDVRRHRNAQDLTRNRGKEDRIHAIDYVDDIAHPPMDRSAKRHREGHRTSRGHVRNQSHERLSGNGKERRPSRSLTRSRSRSRSPRAIERHSSKRRKRDGKGRRHKRRSRSRSPCFDLANTISKAYRRSRRDSPSQQKMNANPQPQSSPTRSPSPPPNAGQAHISTSSHTSQDSDPLESIIGPAPPPPQSKVQKRGRGAFASSSGIDARFSSNYDPTGDVCPNSGSEDDWDQALEALKDRQRWKQQGADRLRAAGFSEQEVTKWEQGGEKREEDVRWKSKDEGREWDRGKVLTSDGDLETAPEWGRLRGT